MRHHGINVLFSRETNNNMEYSYMLCLILTDTLNEAELKFNNSFKK